MKKLNVVLFAVVLPAIAGFGMASFQHWRWKAQHLHDDPPEGWSYVDEYSIRRKEVQPWEVRRMIPLSLTDLGLQDDAKVVVRSFPIDPPYVFLVHDGAGKYFGFCYTMDDAGSRFVIGTLDAREAGALSVAENTPSGRFLANLARMPSHRSLTSLTKRLSSTVGRQ